MEHETCLGIVLQSIDYRDHDRIVTLFSQEFGIIKLMVYGGNGSGKGLQALTTPLTMGEFTFRRGHGDLFTLREGKVRHAHEALRKKWVVLDAACECLKTVVRSQWAEKPAPRLFQLLTKYLDVLPLATDPLTYSASLKLKILLHDGFFFPSESCSACQEPLTEVHIADSHCYCAAHKPSWALGFSEEEKDLLFALILTRSARSLAEIPLDRDFQEKVETLFAAATG